jgi:hypothetical protein
VVNARLTLVDARGRERALFRLMDAEFTRKGDASRSFDMHLDGPRGEWRLSGEVARPDGDHREGVVTAWDAPAEDLLLLSGLSGLPGRASLKVSGRLEASLERGAATRLAGRLEAGAGVIQIDDQGMPDMPVERAALAVSWDEARRVLAFEEASFKAGATDIRLAGELATAEPDRSWRLELAGRDGTLSGAEPGDSRCGSAPSTCGWWAGGRGPRWSACRSGAPRSRPTSTPPSAPRRTGAG